MDSLIAKEATELSQMQKFVDYLSSYITWTHIINVFSFFLVIAVIIFCFKLLDIFVGKITKKNFSVQVQHVVHKVIHYTAFVIVCMTVLNRLGINLTALIGAAGIAGVAIGFAAQTSVSNVISGVFVMTERAFKIDDVIEINGTIGTVQSINLLSIVLKTFDSQYVRVPNETIIKANLINYSQFPIRRVKTEVSVAYGTDLRMVEQVLREVADNNEFALKEPAPSIMWTSFADSGINCTLCTWAELPNFMSLRNSIFLDVDERFKREGIEIPFPQQDVYIKHMVSATEK